MGFPSQRIKPYSEYLDSERQPGNRAAVNHAVHDWPRASEQRHMKLSSTNTTTAAIKL